MRRYAKEMPCGRSWVSPEETAATVETGDLEGDGMTRANPFATSASNRDFSCATARNTMGVRRGEDGPDAMETEGEQEPTEKENSERPASSIEIVREK